MNQPNPPGRLRAAIAAALVCPCLLFCSINLQPASAQNQPESVVTASFPGIPTDFTLEPPDPHGSAGPNGIIQVVNTRIAYWSKTGAAIWGPKSLPSFFGQSVGNGRIQSDCKALYDPATGRFYALILYIDFINYHSYINVAVSKTSDPQDATANSWYLYTIENTRNLGTNSFWGDYPGFGFDGRYMYVTLNLYGFVSGSSDVQITVLDKSAFLSGTTNYSFVYIPGGFRAAFTLQPCTVIGTQDPGNVAYFGETFPFVSNPSTTVRVWALSGTIGSQTISSATVTVPNNGGRPTAGAPQQGTTITVDPLDGRTQGNAFWNNGSMWFCTTAGGSFGRTSAYYYKINTSGFPNGTPTLGEAGSIDGAGQMWTYQPSIGGNARGDICLVYTASSATNYPTIFASARLAANASFDAPVLIKASPSYYNGGRWGDFGSVSVDPVDQSFWVTHEWAGSSKGGDWRTWWANVHVGDLPQILTQPVNTLAFQGDSAIFSVSATGTPPLTYQWLFNGGVLPGATSNQLVLPNLSPGQSGSYSAKVVNPVGSTTSSNATLLVIPTVDLNLALNSSNNLTPLLFSTNGDTGWHGLTNISHDGFASGQSGPVLPSQTSRLSTTVTGPGTLTFWWKVSSLQDSDFLTFYVDNTAQAGISGEVDWDKQTFYLGPGSHNLLWAYGEASDSQGGGLNESWVDEVSYVAGPSLPLIVVPPASQSVLLGKQAVFTVLAGGTPALRYQWRYNGANIPAATKSSYTIAQVQPTHSGPYSVVVTNFYGSVTSAPAILTASGVAAWGDSDFSQGTVVAGLTNVVAIAAGGYHSLALHGGDGSILAWGDDYDGQTDVPPDLAGAIAIAGGGYHSLALRADGSVVGWGANDEGQIDVPASATNAVAIAAGDWHSLALRANGTVVAWGDNTLGQSQVPPGLNNVVAIAAGGQHSLALKADGTVTAWGSDLAPDGTHGGQIDVPFGLGQVVAIAAGDAHSMALKENGSIVTWGDNSAGQTALPSSLTKAVAIAAAGAHSLAIAEGGTVVAWGDNLYTESVVAAGLPRVTAIAAGSYHSLALLGTPASGPAIINPVRAGNNSFSLSFSTATHVGKAYFLEYKNSLSDVAWTVLTGTVGDGNVRTLTDGGATGGARFYRVRQQ